MNPILHQRPQLVFLLETAMGNKTLPNFRHYEKYSDKNVNQLNHGGIAAYIDKTMAPHVFDVKFNECYVSLRFDFMPHLIFIGCYIQPERSLYFRASMFNDLSNLLMYANDKNLTPIMGGDINCRFGNLNTAFKNRKSYTMNIDITSNHHGRTYGIDLCNSTNLIPINHLKYGNTYFQGDFTYHKGDKRSQIDFAFTNNTGLKLIKDFSIIADNWHLSDHRPLLLEINVQTTINCSFLLKRAIDLNYEYDPYHILPKRYLAQYDNTIFKRILEEKFITAENNIRSNLIQKDIENTFQDIDDIIDESYSLSKIPTVMQQTGNSNKMKFANDLFERYRSCVRGEITGNSDDLLKRYREARKEISKEVLKNEQNKWNKLLSEKNSKELWNKINWKGTTKNENHKSPMLEELTSHFKNLYDDQENDLENITNLQTNIYVPNLDDGITSNEIDSAINEMKKGGYDHRVDSFKIITDILSPIMLLLMNTLFFVAFPISLIISLLFTIPKKGNLSLPKNYRGIQMMKAFSILFDRIINNRLTKWIKLHYVQSAFQKLRSTIHQIFTIRLLTEIFKMHKMTLYIGVFDLEKAFDRVSRYKLLKKLVLMGIGKCMLEVLKRMYSNTYCILIHGKEYSKIFQTFTGIKQGAVSSALLFIAFINDLVDYLEEHCAPEPLLEDLNCLLHADDTLILSTSRELFIRKCNHMIDYFTLNSLSLNLSKSGFLVIGGENGEKRDVCLKNGILEYKKSVVYLGVIIGDSGILSEDTDAYIENKRANVTIKYGNFVHRNILAPLDVKLTVLNTCVTASLTYGCETWSRSKIQKLETAYRQGLKTALSIRDCTNNDIVYIESGEMPLYIRISKQQLTFWKSLKSLLADHPLHHIKRLIELGIDCDYIKYFKELDDIYGGDPITCENELISEFRQRHHNTN